MNFAAITQVTSRAGRRLPMLVAAAALAGAMAAPASAATTGTAPADPTVQSLFFQIRPEHSNKCVTSAQLGGLVSQRTCVAGLDTQRWRIDNTGIGGTATLKPAINLGVCLGVSSAGTTNGTRVRGFTCSAQAADQRWDIRFVNGEFYELRPAHAPHMCLDVKTDAAAEGAPLQLWTCLGPNQNNQQFRFLSA